MDEYLFECYLFDNGLIDDIFTVEDSTVSSMWLLCKTDYFQYCRDNGFKAQMF